MEPLKRKILFNRHTEKTDEAKNKPPEDVPETPKVEDVKFRQEPKKWKDPEDKRTRSERMIGWFGSHELISKNGVCELAGIDTSNFNKLLRYGKEIPDKILDKIEPIIKQYGYE
jgi:hypothetical protein